MYVIKARNVNDAYVAGLDFLTHKGETEPSRNGTVIVAPCPVTTIYSKPTERVLFDSRRDANPFFHLMEALWMLAGCQDARWLDQFVSDFSERFAEFDGMQHGAYGHRWRSAFGFDQLTAIVKKLCKNPKDRQCVLQMWDCDEITGCCDLTGDWKDRPCNTHAYFRVRSEYFNQEKVDYLDLTVCCRSNDIVWGAYGANAVHFSVLQEYVATLIGVEVGVYYQVSNNFHVYEDIWQKVRGSIPFTISNNYNTGATFALPIVTDIESFDEEVISFVNGSDVSQFKNGFLKFVAGPMFVAYGLWRAKNRVAAYDTIVTMPDCDWRMACMAWMKRRLDKSPELAHVKA